MTLRLFHLLSASALLVLPISCMEVHGVGDGLEPLVTVNCLLHGNVSGGLGIFGAFVVGEIEH